MVESSPRANINQATTQSTSCPEALAKKRTLVGRALKYMSDNGLEPGEPETAELDPKALEKRTARFIPQLRRGE